MSFIVKLEGKEYPISEETKNVMEFFAEMDAIQKIDTSKPYEMTYLSANVWQEILKLCQIVDNKFPQIAKVKTSDLKQVLGNKLADALSQKSAQQINKLFNAAQYLKIKNLKRCLAAVIACRVYIKPNLTEYEKKRAELKITKKLTAEDSRKFKELYTFMN